MEELQNNVKRYIYRESARLHQGDIFRDISHNVIDTNGAVFSISIPYAVILTQDCDLDQGRDYLGDLPVEPVESNQFIANLIMVPMFPAEHLREGTHLEDLYLVTQKRINSDRWKHVCNNNNLRYHFFKGDITFQLPDLAIDFKHYFTVQARMLVNLYENHYLASINEIFREHLSQRFCNYLSRIALPDV